MIQRASFVRLIPKKVATFFRENVTTSVHAEKYEYPEYRTNRELQGVTKSYAVYLSGNKGRSSHFVTRFPATDEGYAAAEQCAAAIKTSIDWLSEYRVADFERP